MTNHRMRDELDTALGGLIFSPSMQERVRARCGAEPPPRRVPLRLTRRAAVVLAVCAALAATALAVGPTLWGIIQGDLGAKTPYATEVPALCEDQGIRLEVRSALFDNKIAQLYFSLQDITGDRLDGDTQLFFGLENQQEEGNDEMPWNSSSVRQLSYESESHTALFVLTLNGWSTKNRLPLQFSGDWILSGYRTSRDYVMAREDGLSAVPLPSAAADNGTTVLLPEPARVAAWEAMDPDTRPVFPITAVGFASDGKLHVRARISLEGVIWSDIKARVYASEEAGCGVYYGDDENVTQTVVEDGIDYRFDSYGPSDLNRLMQISVEGDYSVHSAPVEGVWAVNIPFEAIPSRDIVIPGELRLTTWVKGETIRADRISLSPLSMTLYCSDLQRDNWVKMPNYQALSVSVYLSDGTAVAPVYVAGNTPWAAWEFSEPIDVDSVTSITIEDQTIPVP